MQLSKDFLKENLLSKLPKSERYRWHSQILRVSRSATANTAEGSGRHHYKENIKFLLNARGSVAEFLDHDLNARFWKYITEETLEEIRSRTSRCIQVINGYIRYLKKVNDEK